MDLTTHVEQLRDQLGRLVGDDAGPVVDRVMGGVDSAVRLVLLEALSAAADEITAELAPGSVQVRLRGRDPEFVVTPPAPEEAFEDAASLSAGEDIPIASEGEAGAATSRINLRLPDVVKQQVEEAASRERLSINTWLLRAVETALHTRRGIQAPRRGPSGGDRFTGWVR